MESIIKKYINLETEETDRQQAENMKQREKSRVTFSVNIEKHHQHHQRHRQQQADREPTGQHEGLARGKQQRASISSCSSSDSCASYGSGYASGSGNSTDHEHKQRSMATSAMHDNHERQVDATQLTSALTTGVSKLDINSNGGNKSSGASEVGADNEHGDHVDGEPDEEEREEEEDGDDGDDDDDEEEAHERDEEEDDDEGDSRLKQHLSELEQLTGELAKRDFHTSRTNVTSADQHFSAAIKSAGSSKTSSVLSSASTSSGGSSNISSLSSASLGNNVVPKPLGMGKEPVATAPPDTRSTSSTPTSHFNGKSEPSVTMSPPAAAANSKIMIANSSSGSGSNSGSTQGNSSWVFQWEQLVSKGVTRPLLINDLDFTDLHDEDDCDLLANGSPKRPGQPLTINIPSTHHQQHQLDHDSVDSGASTGSPSSRSMTGVEPASAPASAPPPLPPPLISPWFNTISAGSRPQSQLMSSPSPTPTPFESQAHEFARDQSPAASSTYSNYSSRNSVCMSQAPAGPFNGLKQQVGGLRSASSMSSLLFGNNPKYANKRKKTMKLFWKEVREDRSLLARLTKKKTIWDEIKPVSVDTSKLEYLFESKAKDLALSKSRNGLDGSTQRKVKITVLDAKRSNAINIGMTKLPPMRTIKSAILKMDSSIMNREGIEKILTTMMPTEEEKSRIIEAQLANPDTPLGTAEQFLLNLASISALEARLKLWAFQLDYAQIEKEVAEPLMDLKQAIDEIERSETFRNILGTLLSIGNFLNSTNAKGFQIDYLEKVPEVKDTVHKHSLLHHLCLFIQEKFDPELSSDLYSEFSAVNRASKVDYSEVAKSLKKMQQDCKASWDHLKIVAKHDGLASLMNTCGASSIGSGGDNSSNCLQHLPKSSGKLNNLSKLSMITTVIGSDSSSSAAVTSGPGGDSQQAGATTKQLKIKVSDFLTDCAERIMVLMVVHRRVMNRFQKLLVYLGCPLHQIKQTQPQHILKIINEFALEYRTKRERVREMLLRKQQNQHHHHHLHHNQHHNQAPGSRWQMNRMRWAGSSHCIDSLSSCYAGSPNSSVSSCASSSSYATANCPDCFTLSNSRRNLTPGASGHRPGSPSGLSQISNYSDFLGDQASCCSRQDSITPVPSIHNDSRRPHSMSVSMMDLQHQQQQQQASRSANNSFNGSAPHTEHNGNHRTYQPTSHNSSLDENQLARQKDEQLRRLLGAGKSLDEACHDLYQMSHWTSTMARHSRTPAYKSRASSLAPWSSRNMDM